MKIQAKLQHHAGSRSHGMADLGLKAPSLSELKRMPKVPTKSIFPNFDRPLAAERCLVRGALLAEASCHR